jgi:xylose isomerase
LNERSKYMQNLVPSETDRFTFGLWTFGNTGRDQFGEPVRKPIDLASDLETLKSLGVYGVSLHDNDLVPFDASYNERLGIIASFKNLTESLGLKVAMVTTNLFSHPIFKEGAFCSNNLDVRRFALSKALKAVDMAAEFGAEIFVMWGGREEFECFGAKDILSSLSRYKEAINLICEYIRQNKIQLKIAFEPKPNEPRGNLFLPAVGHVLAFINELQYPDLVGVNPEFAHEMMSGLSFYYAVAQCLWHNKLFHIDLNAQVPGRYDQDFRFGSEEIKEAFFLVKLLEDYNWRGIKHFDSHPYRTENKEGFGISLNHLCEII